MDPNKFPSILWLYLSAVCLMVLVNRNYEFVISYGKCNSIRSAVFVDINKS